MHAIAELLRLPGTKSEVESFINAATEELNNGEYNPLEVAIRLKAIETALSGIKDVVKDLSYEEAAKYGEKRFEFKGAEIEMKMTGVRYDYSKCNDAAWQKAVDTKKEREKFLKAIKPGTVLFDEEGVEITAPTKKGTESAVITLK